MSEFCLSSKRKELLNNILNIEDKSSHIAIRGLFLQIEEQDKEFIRLLKEGLPSHKNFINKLAGEGVCNGK